MVAAALAVPQHQQSQHYSKGEANDGGLQITPEQWASLNPYPVASSKYTVGGPTVEEIRELWAKFLPLGSH